MKMELSKFQLSSWDLESLGLKLNCEWRPIDLSIRDIPEKESKKPPLQYFFYPTWSPFEVTKPGEKAPESRPIQTIGGLCDRIRTAAFAELQAFHAFQWASEFYTDLDPALRARWKEISYEEVGHLCGLLKLLEKLGEKPSARPVSDWLFFSFLRCKTARDFAHFMASAEERGRIAGEKFSMDYSKYHEEAATLFGKIARDERSHIQTAYAFFPLS